MSTEEMQKEIKRFELAKAAMQGILASSAHSEMDDATIAINSVDIADKMLEVLEKTK